MHPKREAANIGNRAANDFVYTEVFVRQRDDWKLAAVPLIVPPTR